MSNFTAIFFFTKYILSSIYKHSQASSIVLHIFNPFAFSNLYASHLEEKKNHHLTKSVSKFFSEFFLKLTIFREN